MMRSILLLLGTMAAAITPGGERNAARATMPASPGAPAFECQADPEGPAYYAIELITTKRVPGSRMAEGTAAVTYAPSPFGVSLTPDGSYSLDLTISVDRLSAPREGAYVAWITKPDLSEVRRFGALDADNRIDGQSTWNKFLVVISLEPDADTITERWTGPIVLRGMSRSGKMHTMAGHGPFQSEPCAVYGYR